MRREASQLFKLPELYNYINIDETSVTPIYIQLANCLVNAIKSNVFDKNEWLPSINDVSFTYFMSRDTVEKSYRYLKMKGLIGSFPGKGYFINDNDIHRPFRVFLMFNKLSAHKKIIYDSFMETLGTKAQVDFCIYNNDYNLFKKFIRDTVHLNYSHFVLIPHFLEGEECNAHEIINTIPKEKLVLLDKNIPGISGKYAAVYENFEQDIYESLKLAYHDLRRYDTLKLLFPPNSYYPLEIITGFTRFCKQFGFNYRIVADIKYEKIERGDVLLNLTEDDLVTAIELIADTGLKVGVDIGILSYNETPLKKIILNGISTISTNFHYMGRQAAESIITNSNKQIEVPFRFTKRQSL